MRKIIAWIQKPYRWSITFTVLIVCFTSYVLLDAFVIPRSYLVVSGSEENTADYSSDDRSIEKTKQEAVCTDNSYTDGEISIHISTYRRNDTDIYVADIVLNDADSLKTAFADHTYGKNVTGKTSEIAQENEAILAINGDFYGVRDGYVVRNGVLYREDALDEEQEDLVIGEDGSFSIIKEGMVTAEKLVEQGAVQVLSFGPALVTDGAVHVTNDEEVDRAMSSNPRTAIGIIAPLHYVMVVADGRTSESKGLSLYELADFMSEELNTTTAYNLDGGGSSAMYFQGTIINKPTTNGKKITERSVSDIVYIG